MIHQCEQVFKQLDSVLLSQHKSVSQFSLRKYKVRWTLAFLSFLPAPTHDNWKQGPAKTGAAKTRGVWHGRRGEHDTGGHCEQGDSLKPWPCGPLIALESVGMMSDWVPLQLRGEIEMKILKKSYLYDIIKREIWDSMTVKYKTIMVRRGEGGVSRWYAVFSWFTPHPWPQALHTDTGVKNYPLKVPPAVERMELQRVLNIRKLELATSIVNKLPNSFRFTQGETFTFQFYSYKGNKRYEFYLYMWKDTHDQAINMLS